MKFLYLRLVMLLLADNILTASGGVPSVFGALFLRNDENKQIEENSVDDTQIEIAAAENKITALRIEFIKSQILKKLRLKERPVISVGDLPKPLKDDGDNIFPGQDEDISGLNEYYGKTQQVVIFPYEDIPKCSRRTTYPTTCLSFQLPDDMIRSEVSKAELWIHKNTEIARGSNHSVVITEGLIGSEKSSRKATPMIGESLLSDGWTKMDVSDTTQKWMQFEEPQVHEIDIVCKTCSTSDIESPISITDSHKPFIVVYTKSNKKRPATHRRRKRSDNCNLGLNECCRESLYVSFADIGWDDWIIKPEGYNAYFCKGSCTTPSALALSASDHSSILQKFMYNKHGGGQLGFTPCCAATTFQPLQLVFMHSNKTLTTKLLSNMIADSCGCM